MAKRWIQRALKSHKKGSLHKQLRIPNGKRIPKSLLTRIKTAKVGSKIKNPTRTGKRRIQVTTLLKRRAVLAHTLRKLR